MTESVLSFAGLTTSIRSPATIKGPYCSTNASGLQLGRRRGLRRSYITAARLIRRRPEWFAHGELCSDETHLQAFRSVASVQIPKMDIIC
jgi:hypothetical protein